MIAPLTECPLCRTRFVVSKNRAHPSALSELLFGEPKSSAELLIESALVLCPNCGGTFSSNDVRFFGFLSQSQLRALLLCFVTAFAAVAIYFALVQS